MLKIRSEARADASRRNGRAGRGPVTTPGKARSSVNGTTHALRAERVVLRHEDPATYVAHVEKWVTALRPADEAELEVAVAVADARWKLARLDVIEMNHLRAEVLETLDVTDAMKFLRQLEDAALVTKTMAEVVERPRLAGDEDLQALLAAVNRVAEIVRVVERHAPALFLGADELVKAAKLADVLSVRELDGEAYRELALRARACADTVAAQLPAARSAVEAARAEIEKQMPLPDGKRITLMARYRRDCEHRIASEMAFLASMRERRVQVAASGSVGEPVVVCFRVAG